MFLGGVSWLWGSRYGLSIGTIESPRLPTCGVQKMRCLISKGFLMDEDEVMRKATQVIKEARKAIAEAENSMKRTQDFMKKNGLTIDQLKAYLQRQCGSHIFREIEKMAERTMNEARIEADRELRLMRIESKPVQSRAKGLRQFI